MFDLNFLQNELLPALNSGLVLSIALIIPSAIFGFLGGVVLGVLRTFAWRPIRIIGDWYVAIFRGVPLAIQLMMIYFGLPNIGISFEPFFAAVISFILCSSAYQSEYIRGALLSIKQGQINAAKALGFTPLQVILWVILPQAARRALPGCSNEIVYLIKYSSLAYLVTVMELTGQGKIVASTSFRFTEVFLAMGLYYLVLVSIATFFMQKLEKKLAIPGFGHNA